VGNIEGISSEQDLDTLFAGVLRSDSAAELPSRYAWQRLQRQIKREARKRRGIHRATFNLRWIPSPSKFDLEWAKLRL